MKIPGSISSQPRLASQQCFGSQLCKRSFRSLYRPGPPFTGQTPPFSRGTAPVSVRGHVKFSNHEMLGSWREGVALRKLQLKIVSSGLQTTARTQLRNELV